MFISVIVPSLNSPVINLTLESLEKQTLPQDQFEVIVVGMDNDGLIHENELVRFEHTDGPLSPAEARNRGVARAHGDIIAFTDADCIADPHWLEMIAERFSNPEVTVMGGGIEFDTGNYWTLSDNLSMFYEYLAVHPAGWRSQLPSLNLMIRRDAFEDIGGFDEVRYPRPSGEDADLTIRLRKGGSRLFFEPGAKIYHKPRRNSLVDLLRHAYFQGRYSTKIDARYAEGGSIPELLRSRIALVILSAFFAALATVRVFSWNYILKHYWHTIPAIYLAKIAWCIGASGSSLRSISLSED